MFCMCSCEHTLSCLEKPKGLEAKELNAAAYNKLELKGNIDVELLYGDEKTVLESDESYINEVNWRVENETLKVSFEPTCKTLRNRSVKIRVSTKYLDYIRHEGSGDVYSSGTLKYSKMTLDPKSAVLDVRLNMDMDYFGIETGGLSSYQISGTSDRLWIGNYGGDGNIDAGELKVQDVIVSHNGTNTIKVNASQSVEVKCSSTGDVWLYGSPSGVKEESTNTGKLRYK